MRAGAVDQQDVRMEPTAMRVPLPIAVLRVLAIALACVFVLSKVTPLGSVLPPLLTLIVVLGVYFSIAALLLARAVLVRSERLMWALIGTSMLSDAVGTAYQWISTYVGVDVPYPSLADAFWLAIYPLFYCGILTSFRGVRIPARLFVDGAIAGLGGAALFSATVVDMVIRNQHPTGLTGVVTVAYPLGDSLLLGTLLCGVAVGRSTTHRHPLLVAGLGTFVVADTLYIASSNIGTFHPGGLTDVFYHSAVIMIGLAGWRPSRPARTDRRPTSGLGLSPWFAAGALALLITATQMHLSLLAVVLASLTLVLVVVRIYIALRELEAIGLKRHGEARRDSLTGLPNRRAILEHLGRLLDRTSAGPVSMLLLDLDRFKEINDSYGHSAGDQLLQQVAGRLGAVTRDADMLGRLGGDEFVLILPGTDLTRSEGDGLAERIRCDLQRPFELDAAQVTVDVSIGIAAGRETTAAVLFQQADIAMYRAKQSGGGHAAYRQDDDRETRERLELTNALRRDVGGPAMVVHYQPKLDLRSGVIDGFEALVRWQHPELGLIYPDKFLPIAERHGLMPALTHNVLSQAIRQCAEWRTAGHAVSVAVNASATDLRFAHFPQQVAELLELHGLPAKALTVEITETMMLHESPTTEKVLADLSTLGVSISLDDYGTHYSTLSYLKRLHEARELKLDRSFIDDLRSGSSRSAAIVRSTIELAHALGVPVVAEGVEDAETLDILRDWGCDRAQGYHIGRPMPADQAVAGVRVAL